MDKVLVTGAGGFIGQHLVHALQQQGWPVVGMFHAAQPARLKGVIWVQGDVLDEEVIRTACNGCRYFVHLACLPLEACHHQPVQAHEVNVTGTVNCLEAARHEGIEQFLFASSGQVYGGSARLPNREEDLPLPTSAYAGSKLAAETWCRVYGDLYSMSVKTLRLFNVYGRGANHKLRQTVESHFLKQMIRNETPQIVGNPQSGRDFIHIDDVVKALILALSTPKSEGVFNIGTGVMTTLVDLVALIGKILGKETTPAVVDGGVPPIRFQADLSHTKERLGWSHSISLDDGINRLLNCI